MMTPEGETYLFDGGSSDEKNLAQNTLVPFLKSKGVARIDYALVSHTDTDHISGIMELMQGDENYCRGSAAAGGVEKIVMMQITLNLSRLRKTVIFRCGMSKPEILSETVRLRCSVFTRKYHTTRIQ